VDDPSRYGVVPIGADGQVEAFIEKPPAGEAPSHWINAGTYVLEPAALARIPPGRRVSIERSTFPAMVADGLLFALQSDAYWIDAGTPESYLRAQLDLVDGTRPPAEAPVAPGAHVDAGATVAHAIVMAGATVAAGAEVVDSVVLPGAVVGPGAVVSGSIVGEGAVVGEGARLEGLTVVGPGEAVAPGTELVGARLPDTGDR
jgi:mannose-1-phosphate guanylyltransferase